jgi:hypothetical protein
MNYIFLLALSCSSYQVLKVTSVLALMLVFVVSPDPEELGSHILFPTAF